MTRRERIAHKIIVDGFLPALILGWIVDLATVTLRDDPGFAPSPWIGLIASAVQAATLSAAVTLARMEPKAECDSCRAKESAPFQKSESEA